MKKVLIDVIVAVVFVQTIFFYIKNRNQIADTSAEPDSFGFKFVAAMVALATVHAAGTGSAVYTVCQFILNNANKLVNSGSESNSSSTKSTR